MQNVCVCARIYLCVCMRTREERERVLLEGNSCLSVCQAWDLKGWWSKRGGGLGGRRRVKSTAVPVEPWQPLPLGNCNTQNPNYTRRHTHTPGSWREGCFGEPWGVCGVVVKNYLVKSLITPLSARIMDGLCGFKRANLFQYSGFFRCSNCLKWH